MFSAWKVFGGVYTEKIIAGALWTPAWDIVIMLVGSMAEKFLRRPREIVPTGSDRGERVL